VGSWFFFFSLACLLCSWTCTCSSHLIGFIPWFCNKQITWHEFNSTDALWVWHLLPQSHAQSERMSVFSLSVLCVSIASSSFSKTRKQNDHSSVDFSNYYLLIKSLNGHLQKSKRGYAVCKPKTPAHLNKVCENMRGSYFTAGLACGFRGIIWGAYLGEGWSEEAGSDWVKQVMWPPWLSCWPLKA